MIVLNYSTTGKRDKEMEMEMGERSGEKREGNRQRGGGRKRE